MPGNHGNATNARLPCRLMPTRIREANRRDWRTATTVSEADLITGLRRLLEHRLLKFAAGLEHGPTLAKEMVEAEAMPEDTEKATFNPALVDNIIASAATATT